MSRRSEVLDALRLGWICGSEFGYNSRYSARIHELRQQGYLIDSRPCADPAHHHRSRQWQWRLQPVLGDGQLVALLEVSA